eukprot:snap_masked-scaffold_51-processed-gene-0.22-mRNA-1 protein AED:1.00 eAED:1.00 QI:0/0/0/0/1/1/2/0/447
MTETNSSCDSPFIYRLDSNLQSYQITISTLYLLFIILSVALWKLRSWHPALNDKIWEVFVIQSFFAASYAGFTTIFIFNKPNGMTKCGATVFFSVFAHGIPVPGLAINVLLLFRSLHNQKVSTYLTEKSFKDYSMASREDSKQNTNTVTSTQSDESQLKTLRRLRYLGSYKFMQLLMGCTWLILIFSAFLLWLVICKGVFTGKECDLAGSGFIYLYTYGLLVGLSLGILVTYVHFRHSNIMLSKYNEGNSFQILVIGGVPVTLALFINFLNVVSFDTYTKEKISFGPNILLDVGYFLLYFSCGMLFVLKTFDGKKQGQITTDDGVRLKEILKNPVARVFFQEFLIETYCSENLSFINHVSMFKKLKGKALNKRANFIIHGFIESGSYAEINISSLVRQTILEKYSQGLINSTMFEDAEEEIIDLLTFDSLPKFKMTDGYSQHWRNKE